MYTTKANTINQLALKLEFDQQQQYFVHFGILVSREPSAQVVFLVGDIHQCQGKGAL